MSSENRRMIRVAMSLCATFLVSSLGAAQDRAQPIPIEALLSIRSIPDVGGASLSRDGRLFAYAVYSGPSRRAFSGDGGGLKARSSDLWIADTKTGESRNITQGEGRNWAPVWSPDGRFLAFYGDRGSGIRLFAFDRIKRSTHEVPEVKVESYFPWQVPQWEPDSRRVLVMVTPQDQDPSPTAMRPETKPSIAQDPSDPRVLIYSSGDRSDSVVQTTPVSAAASPMRSPRADLALIDVESGKMVRVAEGFVPTWFSISPDGSHIAFSRRKGLVGGEVHQQLFDLLVTAQGEHPQVVGTDILRSTVDFSASWSPDGSLLSYIQLGGQADGEAYVVHVSGTGRRLATTASHPPFFSVIHQTPIWDKAGTHLYFVTSTGVLWEASLADGSGHPLAQIPGGKVSAILEDGNSGTVASPRGHPSNIIVSVLDDVTKGCGFYEIDIREGRYRRLRNDNRAFNPYELYVSASSATVVFSAEDVDHCPNFYRSNLAFSDERRLTDVNPELEKYRMGQSLLVKASSASGEIVEGALLLPAGYKEGHRYPLIVTTYPARVAGCVNQFGLCGKNFFPNKQIFSSRGFAVLFPDAILEEGNLRQGLADRILPVVDKVIALGIADPSRVGIMGHSWGGYAALALITASKRFRAAVVSGGMGDLTSLYGEMSRDGSSLGINIVEPGPELRGLPRLPGPPWKYPELYVANSPIYFLDKIDAPVLIVNGTDDLNVAPFLGDEIFVGLRRLGKRATYVKYIGEAHEIKEYGNQLDLCRRMVEWFETYL